jgi:hypothetical protein
MSAVDALGTWIDAHHAEQIDFLRAIVRVHVFQQPFEPIRGIVAGTEYPHEQRIDVELRRLEVPFPTPTCPDRRQRFGVG